MSHIIGRPDYDLLDVMLGHGADPEQASSAARSRAWRRATASRTACWATSPPSWSCRAGQSHLRQLYADQVIVGAGARSDQAARRRWRRINDGTSVRRGGSCLQPTRGSSLLDGIGCISRRVVPLREAVGTAP